MPATATRKHVCTFEELGDRQKNNAREWMRGLESSDFDTEFLYESFEIAAGILGIEFDQRKDSRKPKIWWSGFSYQGDGASFEGSYRHTPGASDKIRKEFPAETDLHEIADGLTAVQAGYKLLTGRWITAKITQRGNSVHKYTMDANVEDSEGEEDEETDYSILEKRVLDLMRDFADWIYESLKEEYDYRTSDESVEETIRANECTFKSATGELAK